MKNLEYMKMPVAELIPHSPPMVLINRVVDYSAESLVAEVDITEASMFYDESVSGVPAWVGIEYMAQTISALAGIEALENNKEIKLGFLLGARKYNMPHKVFARGEVFSIHVTQLFRGDMGLASFECQITHKGELWVSSTINVFEPDDLQRIIKE